MSPNKIISTLTLWAFFASGSLVAQQGQRVRPGAASGPTAVELSIVVLNVIAIYTKIADPITKFNIKHFTTEQKGEAIAWIKE